MDEPRRPVMRWWHIGLPLILLAAIALWLTGAFGGWSAGASPSALSEVDSSPLAGPNPALQPGSQAPGGLHFITSTCPTANQYFVPEVRSTTGDIRVGDRFVLDLMVHPGARPVTAQQAFLTFPTTLLRSVAPDSTDCTTSWRAEVDIAVFDAVLQNQICPGRTACDFSGTSVQPGTIAYASGDLDNSAATSDFRVARLAFCALTPGEATLTWQFDAPGRVSEVTPPGDVPAARACYADYTVNILPPSR